jgi:hypothetical protein
VVGLLLGEVVSTKNNISLQRRWLAYKKDIVRMIV